MTELEDITAALQFMDEDGLDHLELQIQNRRDDIGREQAPQREFDAVVEFVTSRYRQGSQHGLWWLLALLWDQGYAVCLEYLYGGGRYHASLLRRNGDLLVGVAECLRSEDRYGAFEGEDAVDATARVLGWAVVENYDGMSCFDYSTHLSPSDGVKVVPAAPEGPSYRAIVRLGEDDDPIEVITDMKHEYAAAMAAFCAKDYNPEFEALEPEDVEVEWVEE